MGKIKDFRCTYAHALGPDAILAEELHISFPDAYLHESTMVAMAKALKKRYDVSFCELPFCHTLEAEALGAIINLGDEIAGPRAKSCICQSVDELLVLPEIDFSKGRIAEVLKACRTLHDSGEHVSLLLSGPLTILNALIDGKYIFKAMKREPEKMHQVFQKLQHELLKFCQHALEAGVDIISYADSSGSLNIVGPNIVEDMVEHFTYPFLKNLEQRIAGKAQIFLCPKTSLALIGCERARWKEIQIKETKKYVDACIAEKLQAPIVGQMCIKNTKFCIQKTLKSIELL
ncbi:uroporphyrinogen decarboxylase family protein [Lachnospiraceae bacterium LCP25S3_G4]